MPAKFSAETERHDFLGGKLTLRQPRKGYRAGSDPVLLAACVSARPGQTILDAGAGVGTAGLCLAARVPDCRVTALELQPELSELARANAADNGLADRYEAVCAELGARGGVLGGRMFDHVITNPPWYEPGRAQAPETTSKALGHMEGELSLAQWLRSAGKHVKPKGALWIVHRADRLADILAGLADLPFGAVQVLPLHPRTDKPAGRVIVAARKDSKAPMDVLPGLVMHDESDAFRPDIDAVLRGRAALEGLFWGAK